MFHFLRTHRRSEIIETQFCLQLLISAKIYNLNLFRKKWIILHFFAIQIMNQEKFFIYSLAKNEMFLYDPLKFVCHYRTYNPIILF